MANIDQMKQHYEKAGQYYENANKCPHGSSAQAYWQEKGEDEYKKAGEACEKEKAEIAKEASDKRKEVEQKLDAACDKGDVKAIKKYQAEMEKVNSEEKSKIRDLNNKDLELRNELVNKRDGLEKTKY